MLKKFRVILVLALSVSVFGQRRVALGDWPEQRGPNRDGISKETGLVEKWSLNGENLVWRAPFGGRSAPIIMGNHLYLQNPSGRGAEEQERVMCLDPDTGKVIWQYKFNMFQSDAPAHRVGWASPAVDPETGNVFAIGSGGLTFALTKDGKKIWERSIGEEFGAFTTHGGRMTSPIIDGNLLIVSLAVSTWGPEANRAQRLIAMDKRTGEIVWVSSPGGRPYDTAYAAMSTHTLNGMKLLFTGLGDGGAYALKPQTGEKVWGIVIAKRGLNTGVVASGNTVIISHGDENLDSTEEGMIAAIDGSQKGQIKGYKWAVRGFLGGFSSPIIDGDRVYQIENGSKMIAFDLTTGRQLWKQQLGTVQKAPLVLADGKLYVGTESGKFFIIRPHSERAEVLSEVDLPVSKYSCCSSEGTPEQVLAGAAVSRGRIFFVSSDAVYAIGPRKAKNLTGWAVDEPAEKGEGSPSYLQVEPTELVLKPGQSIKLHARLFDDHGRFLREDTTATWSLAGLKGTVSDGLFTVASDPVDQAGTIKAAVGSLSGAARARVARQMPWTETFESYAEGSVPPGWINAATGRFKVATLDGQKVFEKPADESLFKRIRMFVGPTDWSNYTVEADVRANTKRRQMGDIGVTAQRYTLVLYGNNQQLKIEPWEPEIQRTVMVPFEWKADKWYHLKLRVENLDGKVRARGKAWPTGDPEPAAWMIEKVDPIGNREGAAGVFADAQFGVYLDNLKVAENK